MTTIAEPRIASDVSDIESNPTIDDDIDKLPEPIEDIRPDIGSLMDQWKSESTISPVETNESKFDELIVDEVFEENISEELEDFDLPEWAIEPSSNRSEEVTPEN